MQDHQAASEVQGRSGDRLRSAGRLAKAHRVHRQGSDISRKIGGTFSIGESDVTGINVDLVPGRRIVQAWRHRRFPEGIFSMAAVTLTPTPDGGTELVLVHRGVPKDLIPETEQAWRDQYWSRIKAYLDRRAG